MVFNTYLQSCPTAMKLDYTGSCPLRLLSPHSWACFQVEPWKNQNWYLMFKRKNNNPDEMQRFIDVSFNRDLMRFAEIGFSSPPGVSVQGLIYLEQLAFYLICLNKISLYFIGKRFNYHHFPYCSLRCDLCPVPHPEVCLFHIWYGKRD